VASFFGGAGVIAYAAAWLLIPEEGERMSIGERVVREHRWGRIAGCVLIAIAISIIARPVFWFGGHWVFATGLIVGGLYLLSPGLSGRGESPAAPEAPTAPNPPAPSGASASDLTTELPLDDGSSWPPPPPPPPAPSAPPPGRKRRGGLGSLTGGLLLIGAGVIGLLLAAGNSVEPSYVFAIGLLIVGAALVVSTWVGRSYVLIPIGVVLVGLMSVSTLIDVPITGGVGEKNANPFVLSDLKDDYHLGMGELRLDLTHLTFERGTVHTIKATVGLGHVLVRVPRNVIAELHGHAGLGEVRFLDQHDGGIRIDRDTTLSTAGENPARIVLQLEVGIGQVEVTDAAA
jgi:hypothetical protein